MVSPTNAHAADRSSATVQSARELDKFYTSRAAVEVTLEALERLLVETGRSLDRMTIIEPSAGGGAFLDGLARRGISGALAFDVAPEDPRVRRQDFLALDLATLREPHREMLVLGNPPFGVRARLATEFVNHALDRAETVAFILPAQFRKWITQRTIRDEARLALDIDLPERSFELRGASYGVRCAFQVWTRLPLPGVDLRIRQRPETDHPDFTATQYNRTELAEKYFDMDWDFAVLRQGHGDYGRLWRRDETLCRRKQWIFFKAHSPVALARLRSLDFDALSRTNTAIRGFGKTEVVAAYRAAVDRERAAT